MIKQRTTFDCSVCAYAMYLGRTYEELAQAFKLTHEGIKVSDSVAYLWDQGFDVDWKPNKMPTKKAVVVVYSKNFPGRWHSIFYDGTRFLDPSNYEQYVRWSDVESNLIGSIE